MVTFIVKKILNIAVTFLIILIFFYTLFGFFNKNSIFDFGDSSYYHVATLPLVIGRLKVTLSFISLAMVMSYVLAVFFAFIKNFFKKNKFLTLFEIFILLIQFLPVYVFAIYLILLFSSRDYFNVLPLGGFKSENFYQLSFFEKILDVLKHMLLPLTAYSASIFSELYILCIALISVNSKTEYAKYAKAKGLGNFHIMSIHVLKNSLGTILSTLSSFWATLISTSFIIEKVFSINGFGSLLMDAIQNKDYNVIFCGVFFMVLSISFFRFFGDLVVFLLDPRIKEEMFQSVIKEN